MGLFHIKKGTPASNALPDKSTLKDGVSICTFGLHHMHLSTPYLLSFIPSPDDYRLATPNQERRTQSPNPGLIYIVELNPLVSQVKSKKQIPQLR
jgi:hypothetical protein